MGIPRFLAFLRETFSTLILETFVEPKDGFIEGLYMDLNSPIHALAKAVFNYDNEGTPTELDEQQNRLLDSMNDQQRQILYFGIFGEYLAQVYLKIQPKRRLMFAIDGPAPRAKMTQQRMRRFRPGGAPSNFFDPSVISPGTKFMDALEKYLKFDWPRKYKSFIFDQGVSYIYSGHREAGEGEHKIFEQMNIDKAPRDGPRIFNEYRPLRGRATDYQVVFGADADLIVIALGQVKHNVICMREKITKETDYVKDFVRAQMFTGSNVLIAQNNMKENGFNYINVNHLKVDLAQRFLKPHPPLDFTFMTFFVGNDFIPGLPEMEIVTAPSEVYYTDNEIFIRYRELHEKQTQRGAPFNYKDFIDSLRTLDKDWTRNDGSVNFETRSPLNNDSAERYEIYPKVKHPLHGGQRRVLYFKDKRSNNNRWIQEKRDFGALRLCLQLYKNYISSLERNKRGGSEEYIVRRGDRIDYANLLYFMKVIKRNMLLFLEGHSSQYLHFTNEKNKELKPNADPTILQTVVRKDNDVEFSYSTFVEIHRKKMFGIYDSNFADVNLPKQNVDEMCRKWLEGVQWTLKYYTIGHRSVSSEWFYPYYYAPTLFDLINYIEERMIVTVQNYPGIFVSKINGKATASITMVDGMVDVIEESKDENGEQELDILREPKGSVTTYTDINNQKIAIVRASNGESKYINADSIVFVDRPIKIEVMLPGMSENDNTKWREMKEEDINLIRAGPTEVIDVDSVQRFVMDGVIFNTISNISAPYATVVECLFSIMPERVLKLLMSPKIVDIVLSEIGDDFPVHFETIKENKRYAHATIAKLPFVSAARLKRAIALIPSEFDVEIGALNNRHARLKIFPTLFGQAMLIESDIVVTQRGLARLLHGYGAPSLEQHTTKKQRARKTKKGELSKKSVLLNDQPDEVLEINPMQAEGVTGGYGNIFGIPYPERLVYMKQVQGYKEFEKKIVTSNEEVAAIKAIQTMVVPFDVTQLPPIYYGNLPNNLSYRDATRDELQKYKFDGQRKLLINEIRFLTLYGKLAKKVIYVGSAPGIHIGIVAMMFPDNDFELFDPRKFNISPLPKNVKIFNKLFSNEEALKYRGTATLLISDLRSLGTGRHETAENEREKKLAFEQEELQVAMDNQLQLNIINIMNPVFSMVKFRLPYTLKVENYPYVAGEIWLQPWTQDRSAEVRLIVDGKNVAEIDNTETNMRLNLGGFYKINDPKLRIQQMFNYNKFEYENKLYYYNVVVRRHLKVQTNLGIDNKIIVGAKDNFETGYEAFVIAQWLMSKGDSIANPGFRDRVMAIMYFFIMYIGKDLNHDKIANWTIQGRPTKLPF